MFCNGNSCIGTSLSNIKTGEGFEYLCQITDVVSGVVLAQCMMEHIKAELVGNQAGDEKMADTLGNYTSQQFHKSVYILGGDGPAQGKKQPPALQ